MPKLRVLSGREVLRRGSGLCSVGAVTKMREAQGSGLCVIPCRNMKKTINRSAKKARSVGSEIVEALQNAVAYAKTDHSNGRAYRALVPSRIMSNRSGQTGPAEARPV